MVDNYFNLTGFFLIYGIIFVLVVSASDQIVSNPSSPMNLLFFRSHAINFLPLTVIFLYSGYGDWRIIINGILSSIIFICMDFSFYYFIIKDNEGYVHGLEDFKKNPSLIIKTWLMKIFNKIKN